MRARLSDYSLRSAASLAEALELLAAEPGRWRPLAGGTDLMVVLESGSLQHREYLSLWNLDELRGIDVTEQEVVIGASTTYTDVLGHETLRAEFPLICQAAAETGGVATQNRGTLGGNIANASPAADTPPALIAYDAELDLVSTRGTRRVAYARFHTGYKEMDLRPDELIRAIRLPRPRGRWRQWYRKVGTRRAQAISKVCFAGRLKVSDGLAEDVRLGFASVAPTVVRAIHAEDSVRGRPLDAKSIAAARASLARDLSPIDDDRSTARYRLRIAGNLLEMFLTQGLEGDSNRQGWVST
ncbi:MAG TPA: xanthine dehydrogenase family protein subunit M [Vicinamibacterales bacterium]|nr:xanthine dehydrogenase family protein subunit M [Vicinamibacterales bacterium]